MSSRTVAVGSSAGLHARPATTLSKAAAAAGVPVTIGRVGEEPVKASSILLLMSLGLGHGEEVVLTVEGDDAILDELAALVASDLDA